MKHHFFAALLALILCFGSFCGAAAASQTEIALDGQTLSVAGTLQDGTTYVPLRRFCEDLGDNQVTWDGSQRSATVQGDIQAAFYANSSRAWFNGALQTLTGSSYLKDNTLYVPLRGLAAAMDCSICYDATSQRVILTTAQSYAADDGDAVYWLARIIQAESGGESYQGKLAVGEVILNRVASDQFPNTIYGVIFDRNNGVQFTPVANGTIYNTPSADSVAAARECLAGSSTAGGSLYFFNPTTATKADWMIQNCVYFASIGNHDFYTAR